MKKQFVYADLNSSHDDKIAIFNPLTFWSLIEKYGDVYSGLEILLWSDDEDDKNKPDPILFKGKLVFDEKKKWWLLAIDVKSIQHLSDSMEFKDYTVAEIQNERFS